MKKGVYNKEQVKKFEHKFGDVSEWLKERDWKSRIRSKGVSRVQIPTSPPGAPFV